MTRDLAEPSSNGVARPKVMRRPSHFSSIPESTPTLPKPRELPGFRRMSKFESLEASLALPVPVTAVSQNWQEDLRFGVVMLAIVLLVNVGLMVGLPYIHRSTPVMPSADHLSLLPVPASEGNVTLYSKLPVYDGTKIPTSPSLDNATLSPDGTASVHILGAPN
jgi:hypothetical protein